MRKSPNPTDVYVGHRIRSRRMMLGVSQENLAYAIGLSFQQVQKYEKGENRVGSSRIAQIAEALKVPVSFFFDGGPEAIGATSTVEAAPDYAASFLATSEGVKLARAFTAITDQKLRRAIVGLVEAAAAGEAP